MSSYKTTASGKTKTYKSTVGYEMDLKKFDFDKERKLLTADASDFGSVVNGFWWLRRMSKNNVDFLGIFIKSHHTGKVEAFYLKDEVKDPEGDLLCLTFYPMSKLEKVEKVMIFND